MNNGTKSLSINETFIIEPVDGVEVYSACTAFYTNNLISCSGNTEIIMGIGGVSTNLAFSAVTFYGDGSNLTGISTQDTYITGGTYSAGTAVFTNNTGGTFSVSGFSTGSSFTGGTVSGETIFTGGLSADTFSATTYYNLPSSTFTGGTVSGPTIFTVGLSANTFSATTYFNLPVTADTFTTAFTYSNNVLTLARNQGLSSFTATINSMTGLTINGVLSVTGATALNGVISSTGLSGTTDRMVQVNSAGGVSATAPIITGYITSGGTAANLLENTANWDIDGVYTGTSITGTYQGQKHYNGNYFFEAVNDNLFIRLIRG